MKILFRIIKRFLAALFILVLVAVVGIFGLNFYVKFSTKERIISADEAQRLTGVDCIIVLGAAVRGGDTPSAMLRDRLDKGIELYGDGSLGVMLMSGDHSSQYYDEVSVMKRYAMDAGVPSESIFLDHAGLSTYESMYRARSVFGAKKVIIVSQKYHLYRALYIAKQLGLDAYGVAAEANTYSNQTKRDIREILARDKDFFKAIFKPEPTVIGNPISLTGNGDDTNLP